MQEVLQLPKKYCFTPMVGGHGLRGQETMIIERILTWLGEKFPLEF
jgi:hypothetical protein